MAGMYYNWKFGDFTANVLGVRDTFHVYANPGTYIMYFSDWNTCITAYSTDTIVINAASSINNPSKCKPAVTIFPNPATAKTDLNAEYISPNETKTQIRIFNSLGRNVFEKDYQLVIGENKLRIPISDFAQGVYTMNLQTENVVINAKVIVVGN